MGTGALKEYDTAIGEQMSAQGMTQGRAKFRLLLATAINNASERFGATYEEMALEMQERAAALMELWDETPGKGHLVVASNGHTTGANPRAPNGGGEGQTTHADEADDLFPSSSPTQSRDVGQAISADEAIDKLPTVAATERSGGGQSGFADKAAWAMPPSAAPQGNGVGQHRPADKASDNAPRPVPSLHIPKGKEPGPERLAAQRTVAMSSASAVLSLSHSTRIAGQEFGDWTRQEGMAHWQRNKAHARDTLILRLACAEASNRGAPANKPFRECLDQPTLIRIQKEAMGFIDAA